MHGTARETGQAPDQIPSSTGSRNGPIGTLTIHDRSKGEIPMSAHIEQSTLHLVGFRIEPDIYEPQLYTIYVDGDRPILCQGQPLVFFRPELAAAALRKS